MWWGSARPPLTHSLRTVFGKGMSTSCRHVCGRFSRLPRQYSVPPSDSGGMRSRTTLAERHRFFLSLQRQPFTPRARSSVGYELPDRSYKLGKPGQAMCRKDLTVFLDAEGYRRVQTALMVLEAFLGTLALLLAVGTVYQAIGM